MTETLKYVVGILSDVFSRLMTTFVLATANFTVDLTSQIVIIILLFAVYVSFPSFHLAVTEYTGHN